jgi:tRNA U34 5-carboxymethylaminomethyl modifying enzyme MnmG/GidA
VITRVGKNTASRSKETASRVGKTTLHRTLAPSSQPLIHHSPHSSYSAFDLLRHPTVTPAQLIPAIPALAHVDPLVLARVHIDGRYDAHLRRQAADVRAFQDDEGLVLDPLMDYSVVEGLSLEVKERLARVRPTNIVSWSISDHLLFSAFLSCDLGKLCADFLSFPFFLCV